MVKIASLLHDVDDRKYFTTENNKNARMLIDQVFDK